MTRKPIPFATSAEEHFQMWHEIREESDRAAAIIAFAYLDDRLTEVIKAFLHTRRRTTKELFKGLGPLVSTAARSKLAYSLGFFGPLTLKNLNDLADIRNLFAHQKKRWKFASPEISKRCMKLNINKRVLKMGREKSPTDPRELYLDAISMIADVLWSELTQNPPPPPREPRFLKW